MNRRSFLKQSCFSCANLVALGALPALLEGCIALPTINFQQAKNILEIDKQQFVNPKTKVKSNVLLLRPTWMNYDILLVHNEQEKTYTALYMKCSHEDYRLTPTENGIFCSAHGSAFDLQGNVKKSPALQALKTFPTQIINDTIYVQLKS